MLQEYSVASDKASASLVERHAAWLAADIQHGYTINSPKEIEKYASTALRTFKAGSKNSN